MAWTVEFDSAADKDLGKIYPQQKRLILKYLKKNIAGIFVGHTSNSNFTTTCGVNCQISVPNELNWYNTV